MAERHVVVVGGTGKVGPSRGGVSAGERRAGPNHYADSPIWREALAATR